MQILGAEDIMRVIVTENGYTYPLEVDSLEINRSAQSVELTTGKDIKFLSVEDETDFSVEWTDRNGKVHRYDPAQEGMARLAEMVEEEDDY